MRQKRGGKGFMTIEIDLEKAYDRLSWKFIDKTLKGLGFPSTWVRNIMHCITTPRMSEWEEIRALPTYARYSSRGCHIPLHFRSWSAWDK